MKFTIEIEADNDAFGDTDETRRYELARILGGLCDKLVHGDDIDGSLRDYNGNTVGHWLLKGEVPAADHVPVRKYIVVENSGMVGECDIGGFFDTAQEAWDYIKAHYDDDERDRFHKNCLFPEVALEIDGERTYDFG